MLTAIEQLKVTSSDSIKIKLSDYGKVWLYSHGYWLRASQDWIKDFNQNKNKPAYFILYWTDTIHNRHYFKQYNGDGKNWHSLGE